MTFRLGGMTGGWWFCRNGGLEKKKEPKSRTGASKMTRIMPRRLQFVTMWMRLQVTESGTKYVTRNMIYCGNRQDNHYKRYTNCIVISGIVRIAIYVMGGFHWTQTAPKVFYKEWKRENYEFNWTVQFGSISVTAVESHHDCCMCSGREELNTNCPEICERALQIKRHHQNPASLFSHSNEESEVGVLPIKGGDWDAHPCFYSFGAVPKHTISETKLRTWLMCVIN